MIKGLPLYATVALFTISTVTAPSSELNSVKVSEPDTVIRDPIVQTMAIPNIVSIKPIEETALPILSIAKDIAYTFSAMGTYPNTYDWGQCTWGVASMKHDIPSNWGNANMWPDSAKAAGYTVGNIPKLGSVGVSYEGAFGHVVVVTAINSDGTIQITETNYAGELGVVHTRNVSPSSFVYIYI